MHIDRLTSLTDGAAYIQRLDAGVLLLEDADRVDFLQRITTNHIAALRTGHAVVTVLTSPVARILHVFTVLCREDDLVLLPAPADQKSLERRLLGQIFFMDQVRVRNVSADLARVRVVGARAKSALNALGLETPPDDRWLTKDGTLILAQSRYDLPGFELVTPADRAGGLLRALNASGVAALDEEEAVALRIALGRPAPGSELTEEYNPLETGMGWACAEDKGCYTGQEILARQRTYDKTTRSLVGVASESHVARGAALTADGREVGRVTSVTARPDGPGAIGLAIVKRPQNEPGRVLEADGADVIVTALPFFDTGASEPR